MRILATDTQASLLYDILFIAAIKLGFKSGFAKLWSMHVCVRMK